VAHGDYRAVVQPGCLPLGVVRGGQEARRKILNLKRILELLTLFKDQPASRTEITDVGRRIKLDLGSKEQRNRGLDRDQVKAMAYESPVISSWIEAIPKQDSQAE
jgi:hypothetical protein